MSFLSNSLLCTSDIELIESCLKRAVECSKSKCLLKIGREESRQLVADHIVKGVWQTVEDSSGEGHWKDEKEYALFKAHCWMFLAWMNSSLGLQNVDETFTPINTTFYLETVRSLKFENFMVQCLCQVDKKAMETLTQDILNCIRDTREEEDKHFLLNFFEECLKLLCRDRTSNHKTTERLLSILTLVTSQVKYQALQLTIIKKLAQETRKLFLEFKQESESDDNDKKLYCSGYSVDVFTGKQNIIEFDRKMKQFLDEANIKSGRFQSPVQEKIFQKKQLSGLAHQNLNHSERTESRMNNLEAILDLVHRIHQLITCEWKSLFFCESDVTESAVIQNVEQPDSHAVLFTIFTTCLSLQRYVKHSEEDIKKLQVLVDGLTPYVQSQATLEEKAIISGLLGEQGIKEAENKLTQVDTSGKTDESLNDELEKAIFRIQENLFGDETYFEWLLMTEELYQDQRWLECVITNGKKFVSTTTVKMLLDVLCVLRESVTSQDSPEGNIYKSLTQVIVDLLPCLSLQEQAQVIVYNLELIWLHFESYTNQSLFLLPGDPWASMGWATETLTATMNKMVNKAEEGFSTEVLTGISIAALIAPYVTLKGLLTEAVKHAGYENVVCELLQTMPWLAGLHCGEHDHLLLRALHDILTTLASKKQESQYLKLVGALLRPYVHPTLGRKELPLLLPHEVMNELIQPLLTTEDNGGVSLTFVLDILMTTLSCPQASPSQQHHWILDHKPFEVLFTLLEMYQDCAHFWQDWVSDASGDEEMERDDFALDEAWTEMNIAVKVLNEHLIPLLAEAISQGPSKYASHVVWMENQLNKLDWPASVLVLPLLQNDAISCAIKIPKLLVHLIATSQLNALPLNDTDGVESFWTVYLKSCALSNEVFGIYLSKLGEGHPNEIESDSQIFIESLANMLPFSTSLQWQRLLNIARELLKYGYVNLKEEEWTTKLVDLPEVHISDPSSSCIVNMSALLVSVLRCLSTKDWATSYVWNTTLKNYVSKIKQLSLTVEKQDEFVVTCHLLAHLNVIAFNLIPEGFHEAITIVMLDVLNTCLSSIPNAKDKNSKHLEYLQHIIDTIPLPELRMTMASKVQKVVSNMEK